MLLLRPCRGSPAGPVFQHASTVASLRQAGRVADATKGIWLPRDLQPRVAGQAQQQLGAETHRINLSLAGGDPPHNLVNSPQVVAPCRNRSATALPRVSVRPTRRAVSPHPLSLPAARSTQGRGGNRRKSADRRARSRHRRRPGAVGSRSRRKPNRPSVPACGALRKSTRYRG